MPDFLLPDRGMGVELGAHVVAAAFDRAGRFAAFALGDGTLRLAGADEAWREVRVHDGAVLALATDSQDGFLTGGDDGRFRRVLPLGSVVDLGKFGSKWVEHVASDKSGLLACSVGRLTKIFDGGGRELKTLEHPSTVTGLAFDAKGKRIAASHYNGASLWFVASKTDNARKLEWKGSHTGIAINPDGDTVVTTMQENALHGWRLSDGQHMRMTGYPTKIRSMSFTRNGKWLATSGADCIVTWPFFGGGPMGKPPVELAPAEGLTCTAVACHPQHDAVAAGYGDGTVILVDITSARVLPVAPAGRGSVTCLAWRPDGAALAIGTDTGFAAIVDLSRR